MSNWEKQHKEVIQDFLRYINKQTDCFILKGGTALILCYHLPRFSEDIDLDAEKENILTYVEKFCKLRNYKFRIGKDTPTVKRCFVNYGNEKKPLKIEVSYRNKNIERANCVEINDIHVYNVNRLAKMKAMAYASRDKIRDMYDLSFICAGFWDELSKETKESIKDALEYKGLEQFEYILATQPDELINEEELLSGFLQMYDKIGLLSDSAVPTKDEISEQKFISEHQAHHIQNTELRKDYEKYLDDAIKAALKLRTPEGREEAFHDYMEKRLLDRHSRDEVAQALNQAKEQEFSR